MSRHVLIIAAGAADHPLKSLDGCTPLEAAATPALDRIAATGRQGTIRTIPEGFAASRDLATLGLAGYDVRDPYCGYAGIEALGRRAIPGASEIALRCNFATVADGVLIDSTAGRLTTDEAGRLSEALNGALAGRGVRFCAGLSYRGLMTAPRAWDGVVCTPAHDMIGQAVEANRPSGRGSRELRDVMAAAGEVLNSHEVNRARRELGERPANAIWPWGQGVLPRVKRFRERYGRRAAAVGAVDLFRGVGLLLGWNVLEIAGATGSMDTDFAAKGKAAAAAIDEHELVVVHVEAPYEAGLAGDAVGKVRAIEQIDATIVGPLLERLRRWERWGIAFASDVVVHSEARRQTAEVTPVCLAGSAHTGPVHGGTDSGHGAGFGERNAGDADLRIEAAAEFMEYFLRG